MPQHALNSPRHVRRRSVTLHATPTTFHTRSIAITPDIKRLITEGAQVAIEVSGGKASQAAALETFPVLDRLGHSGLPSV